MSSSAVQCSTHDYMHMHKHIHIHITCTCTCTSSSGGGGVLTAVVECGVLVELRRHVAGDRPRADLAEARAVEDRVEGTHGAH